MSLITLDNANTLYENVIKEYIESNKLAKDITKKTLLQIYNTSNCPKSEIDSQVVYRKEYKSNHQSIR